jgi:hypothetical protein
VEYQGEDLDTSAEFNRVEPYIISDDFDLSSYERSEFNKYTVLVEASITRGRDGDLHFDRYVAFLRTWCFELPPFSASLPRFLISSLPHLLPSSSPRSLAAACERAFKSLP